MYTLVKQSKYIIILWLLALPLANFGGYYEGVKVLVYLVGCIAITIYLVFHRPVFHFRDVIYWLWLAILTYASLNGIHPLESIWGGSYRHQGVIFFLGLWVILKFIESLEPDDKRLLLLGFLPLICFESLIVISQKVSGLNLLNSRPMGTFGEPNATAGFLAVGMYLVFKGLREIKLGKIIWPFAILVLIAVFITGSRSGLLASGCVLVSLIPIRSVNSIFTSGLLIRTDSLYENRLTFWQMAIDGIKRRPLWGYGAESGEVFYNLAFAKAEMPLVGLIVDRSHNIFLDVAMWSGLIGLGVFILWFIVNWKNSWGLVAWLIFASLQPLGVVHWMLLLLLFGL